MSYIETYEYRIVQISPISLNVVRLENQLNELGQDGWYVLDSLPDYILLERITERLIED